MSSVHAAPAAGLRRCSPLSGTPTREEVREQAPGDEGDECQTKARGRDPREEDAELSRVERVRARGDEGQRECENERGAKERQGEAFRLKEGPMCGGPLAPHWAEPGRG